MQVRYFPWAIAGGTCVTLAPGTPLWILPLMGAMAHMAYDVDPKAWQDTGRNLLTTVKQVELPSRVKALAGKTQESGTPTSKAQVVKEAPNDQADPFSEALARVQQPTQERDPLLQTLEQEPHRLIIGRSRGGKTTLIHEMATHWADEGAKVVVCDPDAMPGLWPGCTVVGAGNNIAAIEKVLKVTAQEYERRQQLRGEGQLTFRPIHVVIDEAHEVLPVIDGGLEIFEDITRRGAKHGVHLTIGVQDKQVGTLGLKGKSELLKNFIVADVLKDTQGQRKAVIQDAVTGKKTAWTIPALRNPMELVKKQSAAPSVVARVTASSPVAALGETERLPKQNDDTLLAGLLANDLPKQETTATITKDGLTINVNASATTTRTYSRRGAGANVRQRAMRVRQNKKAETLEEAYARLYAEGVPSFRQAYEAMGRKGDKHKALGAWNKAKASAKGATKP